ncbi:MAG: hypothetical protein ABIR59_08705 [Gemmatimonadales bacterium]
MQHRGIVIPFFVTLSLLALPLGGARAQDSRVMSRFPAPVATRVNALVDSALRAGLPTEPIVLRALEGHAKGIDPDRIVAALSRLRMALQVARAALGPASSTIELTTAAAALQAGVAEQRLVELHQIRGTQSVTTPLGAYLDLVARGAQPDRAWAHVANLARRRAGDAEFVRLMPRDVERTVAEPRTSNATGTGTP